MININYISVYQIMLNIISNIKKYSVFFLYYNLFFITTAVAINSNNKEADDDNSSVSQYDWSLIPAGPGGGWQTAIGRNLSNQNYLKKGHNPLLPEPEHFTGTWFGGRDWLYKHGITINVDNVNEPFGNVTGGRRKGITNAGSVDSNLDIDWGTLVGKNWFTNDLVFHMTVINRYGNNLGKIVGETITKTQQIYGGGGNVVAKLVNLYVDKHLWKNKIIISAGRMDVGGFYARSPIQCYLVNSGICGTPRTLTGQAGGFNTYPDSEWSTSILFHPTRQFYIRIGAYQVSRALYTNSAGKRAGWASLVSTKMDAGIELPIEMGYETHFGQYNLVGHYKVGFAYDTSAYPVWGRGVNGEKLTTIKGPNQDWVRGRDQEWGLADQMLYRNGPGDLNGIIAYVGLLHDNPTTFQYKNEIITALINTGFWKSRPMDGIGILFIHQSISKRLRRAQQYSLSQGTPIDSLLGSASGVQTAENSFELGYIIHVMDGVFFQPDFQYEIHPNAQKNIPNAAYFGFRSHVDF